MSEKRFKIMVTHIDPQVREECPASISYSIIEPHREQAMMNHSQTLERLSERGGLDPLELLAVLEDRQWRTINDIPVREAVARIKRVVNDGLKEGGSPTT